MADVDEVVMLLEEIRDATMELKDAVERNGSVQTDDDGDSDGWSGVSLGEETAMDVLHILDNLPTGSATSNMVKPFTKYESSAVLSKLHKVGLVDREKMSGKKALQYRYWVNDDGYEWMADQSPGEETGAGGVTHD